MSSTPRAGYPPEGAPPAAVFVDLDGTLISASSEKLFLGRLFRTGALGPAAFVRFLLRYALHPARTLREGKGWNRSYLKGLPSRETAACAERLGREVLSGLRRPWTLEAVNVLVGRGWRAVLLSASLEPLSAAMAREGAFHEVIASRPEAAGGVLTGRLEGPRPWGAEKARLAADYCAGHGFAPASCLAIADSWSDRHLMRLCGRAVAVCPDPRLRRLAAEKGWDVVEGRHAAWA